jgi:hypothetical protein
MIGLIAKNSPPYVLTPLPPLYRFAFLKLKVPIKCAKKKIGAQCPMIANNPEK